MLLATVASWRQDIGQVFLPCGSAHHALESRSLAGAGAVPLVVFSVSDRQCHRVVTDGWIVSDVAHAVRLVPGVGGGLQRLGGAEVRVDGMIVGGW